MADKVDADLEGVSALNRYLRHLRRHQERIQPDIKALAEHPHEALQTVGVMLNNTEALHEQMALWLARQISQANRLDPEAMVMEQQILQLLDGLWGFFTDPTEATDEG